MEDNYLRTELYALMQNDSKFFDFLQEGSLDGIWYWDLEKMENEWMSPQFWTTLGFDPRTKQHLASEWQHLIFDEDLETAKENLMQHLENPSHPYDQIVRYKHKLGRTIWIRCRGVAIRDTETKKPLRMLGAHTNITSLMQSEAKVKAMQYQVEALQMRIQSLNIKLELKDSKIDKLIADIEKLKQS